MDIVTDHKWKQFLYGYELPDKVLYRDFDFIRHPETYDQFIKYRGRYYYIEQFTCTDIEGWDGVCADSYFSGILIKISKDGESYKIGTYYA